VRPLFGARRGGRTGSVLLAPCIAPGTVSGTAYNHYTMLGSVEKIFGLSYLGYAGLPHSKYFGTNIYKRPCGPAPPVVRIQDTIKPIGGSSRLHFSLRWSASTTGGTPLASYEVQERRSGAWRTLEKSTHRTSLSFTGRVNQAYRFRVRGVDTAGEVGKWAGAQLAGTT
jgi:hypothetical protein